MTAGAVTDNRVTPGLGWPREVRPDPRIGWPNVSRETIDWPRTPPPIADDGTTAQQSIDQPVDLVWPPVPIELLPRAHGPRRARFDEDEAGPPPLPIESPPDVSRETSPSAEFPAPPATRIFVVANQKGGVGKTTSAVNLAAALALGGLSVLIVDLDPQGNASTAVGVDHTPGTMGSYEVVIGGEAIADLVVDSPEAAGLKVLPATIDLAGAEIELVSMVAREARLLRALQAYLENNPTDYVFLDCPPSLGLLTLNAFVAANEILIPIQCEYYALEGVSQLMRTINLVKGELNNDLKLSTVLLTMYDARTRLSAQVAQEVRTHFATETLPVVIPRSVRISEAPSYGQTVLTYHPDSAGAVSYLQAAHEIARRGSVQSRGTPPSPPGCRGDAMTTTTERRGLGRGLGELFQRTDLATVPPPVATTPGASDAAAGGRPERPGGPEHSRGLVLRRGADRRCDA